MTFNHTLEIPVRFTDIDLLGHVNNARYLTYMEEARLAYAKDLGAWDGRTDTLTLILASVKIDYKAPVVLGGVIKVRTRVARIGNKSITYEHDIHARHPNEAVKQAAFATAILVTMNYETGESVRVPEAWREIIRAHEPDLDER